jgi:hypothetical protein
MLAGNIRLFSGGKAMKMFLFMSLFFLVGGILSVNAQDMIILKNGDEIEAKVIEISPTEIRYKRFSNLDGPTMVIPAANVSIIIFEDGTREIIIAENPVSPNNTNTQNVFSDPKAKRAEDNKWPAFALNLLLGAGIGSFVQGDGDGGTLCLLGEVVCWSCILLANNETSLILSVTALSFVRISELIRPFVYAKSFSVAVSPVINNNGQLALATMVNFKF